MIIKGCFRLARFFKLASRLLPRKFQKITGGDPNYLQGLLDTSLIQSLHKSTDQSLNIEVVSERISDAIPELSDEIAAVLYKSLSERAESTVKEWSKTRKSFEKRHHKLWQKGFTLLDAFIIGSFEAGQNFNNHHRDKAAQNQDYVFDVLTRLHARSIHIAWEVVSLLKAGYADGAHARWRTAHEISVVATFIAKNGQDVALRYLEHEAIESYRAACQYQENACRLNVREYSAKEMAQLKERYDKLSERYGPSFLTQYGWASQATNKKRPNFSDLEEMVELNHLRPYYKMASHNVHANPKGIMFRLGLSKESGLLLAGPSNYGLADPAHSIVISILQTTVAMLNLESNMDSIVIGKVLLKFADDIGDVFLGIQQEMEIHDVLVQEATS